MNQKHKVFLDDCEAPTRNDEYLFYQVLIGTWPSGENATSEKLTKRLQNYMLKAAREAKVSTSWANQNEQYENALVSFIGAVLDSGHQEFLADFLPFQHLVAKCGAMNSLSQALIKFCSPGVPDIYQGNELNVFSLVDPDNRRPVDFTGRADLLAQLDQGWLPGIDASGAAKLLVVSRTLRARRDQPERFTGYLPLRATGPAASHAVAFARRGVVAVATRLPVGLATGGGWGATALVLPEGSWTDAFTGLSTSGEVALTELLARFPVALLIAD